MQKENKIEIRLCIKLKDNNNLIIITMKKMTIMAIQQDY